MTCVAPELNAASDSVDYFVTIIVRRLEQNFRKMPSSMSFCEVLFAGSAAGQSGIPAHGPTRIASTLSGRTSELDTLSAPYGQDSRR